MFLYSHVIKSYDEQEFSSLLDLYLTSNLPSYDVTYFSFYDHKVGLVCFVAIIEVFDLD